jgi:ferredoxin-NADP reductase
MFGLLKSHRLTYHDRHDVGGGVWSFAFRPDLALHARAGQHGILQLGAASMKPFSLASAPEEELVLIGTSLASRSGFKQRLASLRTGDTVTLRGPINDFTLDTTRGPVVMLAQGVGITPLRSMLAHVALTDLPIRSTLIHVAAGGHAYRQDTEAWATRSAYPQHAETFRSAAIAAAQGDPTATFFVAGASPFVSSTAALLTDQGVSPRSIRRDTYLGYRPRPAVTPEPEAAAGSLR